LPSIIFCVTNDLNYDQRMIRICHSMSQAGYDVTLTGRKKRNSPPSETMPFKQKRISCFFESGKLFYLEFNIRLFFFLLSRKTDAICAIDLDTILPCLWASQLKKTQRIYDAHELFCEMKEISSRPGIYKVWKSIEKYALPKFKHNYTVNHVIADELKKLYNNDYEVIRSIAVYNPEKFQYQKEKFILYQGAVNHGRSFETLIPAMKQVNGKLVICGDGNFMKQAKELCRYHKLEDKIIFTGMLTPSALQEYTGKAYIGITLFEKGARSNYYSLANRFFDYIHAGTPQICVNYPLYEELNKKYDIGVLINDLKPESIAEVLGRLLEDETTWKRLHENCKKAAMELCWQNEEKILIAFYKKIIG